MQKPKFEVVREWLVKTTVALVLAAYMSQFAQLNSLLQVYYILAFSLLFLVALSVVKLAWVSTEKIISFIREPNVKNIKLDSLPLTNNEIKLKISNSEIRKPQVIVSRVQIGIKGQDKWLSVQKNNSTLELFKSVEIPFIKLHPTENTFSIIYPEYDDLEQFGYGQYKFDVVVSYGYLSRREWLLSRYIVDFEYSPDVIKINSIKKAT